VWDGIQSFSLALEEITCVLVKIVIKILAEEAGEGLTASPEYSSH
jgi:hypothetical protein